MTTKQSNIRQSGNSLVVTIPWEVVREFELAHGDAVFWESSPGGDNSLRLKIVKGEQIRKLASQA
jgi:antitoxin component of MazEF toxin-antitoxin module